MALWSVGANLLLIMTTDDVADVFPHFDAPATGSFSPVIELDSTILGRRHLVRVYLPPGYHENTLRRYPVLYMQDGKNLFFPEEAFLGREWGVGEALHLLDTMNAVDRVVIVGVYSGDRMAEYTKPGYEAYARSVVEEIKPEVDRRIRVLRLAPRDGRHRLVARRRGLVLHGLGVPAGLRLRRLHVEHLLPQGRPHRPRPRRAEARVEVLPGQRLAGRQLRGHAGHGHGPRAPAGYRVREDFLHLVFPLEEHDERAWGRRLHLPCSSASERPPPPSAAARTLDLRSLRGASLAQPVLDPRLEKGVGDRQDDGPDEDPDQAEAEHAPDDAGEDQQQRQVRPLLINTGRRTLSRALTATLQTSRTVPQALSPTSTSRRPPGTGRAPVPAGRCTGSA